MISIVGTLSSADVIVGDVVASLSIETENEGIDVPKPRNYKVSVYRDGGHLRTVRDGAVQHLLVETIDHVGTVNHEEYVVVGVYGTWVLSRTEVITTGAEADAGGPGVIQVPMPGAIIALSVKEGVRVEVGDALLIMGAMGMEHILTAEIVGKANFAVVPGDQATGDQQLTVITVAEG